MTPSPDVPLLRAALAEAAPGAVLEFHDLLPSTIDRCRALAELGAPEGTTVVASRQASGRGQAGRSWFSPPGGVYLSVLLRPAFPASEAGVLAPLAGLAACEGLRALGVPCRLKLPNDLVAVREGAWRKLGGMLVDTAIQGGEVRHAVVSFGINVALRGMELPDGLAALATSCDDLSARPPARGEVMAELARRLVAEAAGLADPARRGDLLRRHAGHVRNVAHGEPARAGAEA